MEASWALGGEHVGIECSYLPGPCVAELEQQGSRNSPKAWHCYWGLSDRVHKKKAVLGSEVSALQL